MKEWLTLADFDQMLSEIAQAPTIAVDTFPVEPTDIVVLPIGVIVALLGPGEFVAREDHRRSTGQEEGSEHVSHLTQSKASYLGVVGRSFCSMIPGDIVRMAVAVAFSVRVIVLVVV